MSLKSALSVSDRDLVDWQEIIFVTSSCREACFWYTGTVRAIAEIDCIGVSANLQVGADINNIPCFTEYDTLNKKNCREWKPS